ncbi:MAG: hypothetical protein NT075_37315, partial [Chloroflexi bacterium]|nr:hypothetical protein [Chloroflexota bacterium]
SRLEIRPQPSCWRGLSKREDSTDCSSSGDKTEDNLVVVQMITHLHTSIVPQRVKGRANKDAAGHRQFTIAGGIKADLILMGMV